MCFGEHVDGRGDKIRRINYLAVLLIGVVADGTFHEVDVAGFGVVGHPCGLLLVEDRHLNPIGDFLFRPFGVGLGAIGHNVDLCTLLKSRDGTDVSADWESVDAFHLVNPAIL